MREGRREVLHGGNTGLLGGIPSLLQNQFSVAPNFHSAEVLIVSSKELGSDHAVKTVLHESTEYFKIGS